MFFEFFGEEFHLVDTCKYIQFIFRYAAEKITKFLHKEKKISDIYKVTLFRRNLFDYYRMNIIIIKYKWR